MAEEAWTRIHVKRAACEHRICNEGILELCALDHQGRRRRYSVRSAHGVIAVVQTIGYQEYDGLGWYAVIGEGP